MTHEHDQNSFASFFRTAVGHEPFAFQRRFARELPGWFPPSSVGTPARRLALRDRLSDGELSQATAIVRAPQDRAGDVLTFGSGEATWIE